MRLILVLDESSNSVEFVVSVKSALVNADLHDTEVFSWLTDAARPGPNGPGFFLVANETNSKFEACGWDRPFDKYHLDLYNNAYGTFTVWDTRIHLPSGFIGIAAREIATYIRKRRGLVAELNKRDLSSPFFRQPLPLP